MGSACPPPVGQTLSNLFPSAATELPTPEATPLPTKTFTLRKYWHVAALSSGEAWAVGDAGAIAHYKDGRWNGDTVTDPSLQIKDLQSVSMTSSNEWMGCRRRQYDSPLCWQWSMDKA